MGSSIVGVSDALCEFVDNSIQATQNPDICPTRDISVYVSVDKGTGYAIIHDNGCGMTQDQLETFARYSYSKEMRDETNDSFLEANVNNISKYGVGAKQAAFYLGSKLHVITKSPNSSCVLEFVMDPDDMKKRFRNKQDNVIV